MPYSPLGKSEKLLSTQNETDKGVLRRFRRVAYSSLDDWLLGGIRT